VGAFCAAGHFKSSVILAFLNAMLNGEVVGVPLKTEKRRSHCPVFSFRPRVRRAEGLPGMTTEDLHGHEGRSAPPALLPLVCMVIPDHSSFSVLRGTPTTFAYGHFKKLECYQKQGLSAWLRPVAALAGC